MEKVDTLLVSLNKRIYDNDSTQYDDKAVLWKKAVERITDTYSCFNYFNKSRHLIAWRSFILLSQIRVHGANMGLT